MIKFSAVKATTARTPARRRATRSFWRAPRWLVVLVVLAVGSVTLATTEAPISANTVQCSTNVYHDAQAAKANFTNDCGTPFQETPAFSCTWVSESGGGFQCTGPGNQQAAQPTPTPEANGLTTAGAEEIVELGVAPTSHCVSEVYPNAQTAKANFTNDCGTPFQETPAFSCTWVSESGGGFQCTGPGNQQAAQPTPTAQPTQPTTTTTTTTVAPPPVEIVTVVDSSSILDGDPLLGEFGRGEAVESLGTISGVTSAQRGELFAANMEPLNDLLDLLQDSPDDAELVGDIEDLAFIQALLALNVEPNHKSELWTLWRDIEFGIAPDVPFLGPVDPNRPICDGPQPVLGGPNTVSCQRPEFTAHGESFNAASRSERIAYYGFDETEWEFATAFIQLSYEMDMIQDDLEDFINPIFNFLATSIISFITAGAASAAFATVFGVSATSFSAVAFGASFSSYGVTLFTTGSTSQAEKAALAGLFSAGASQLSNVQFADRPASTNLTIAVLAGGASNLDNGNFVQGFLQSLLLQYGPGLLDLLPFDLDFLEARMSDPALLEDLGVELISSHITHDGDWERVAIDVASFLEDEIPELENSLQP